jgi:hypothetical protein
MDILYSLDGSGATCVAEVVQLGTWLIPIIKNKKALARPTLYRASLSLGVKWITTGVGHDTDSYGEL